MNVTHCLLMILVMDVITFATRAIPFFIFDGKRQTPPFILYLGRVLPYSVLAMLIVYCVRNVSWGTAPHGAPELISICFTAVMHFWKKNSLLSIAGGTALYMILIQNVF